MLLTSNNTNTTPLPTPQSLADEWMTPEQLEAEIGLNIAAQERMRMKKRQLSDKNPLPFSKFGRVIRYSRKRINEWLLNNEQKG